MRSFAKINIFLKIVGTRGAYHEICSRFVLYEKLYDEIEFASGTFDDLEIIGEFDCKKEQNTIYKAYLGLLSKRPIVRDFFKKNCVKVIKRIPPYAGLGGGSSNGATFLVMCNEFLELRLSKDELLEIALKIGADVPFFISGYKSANVSGIGEVITEYEDEIPEIELIFNPVKSSTKDVYNCFRERFFRLFDKKECQKFEQKSSKELLSYYKPEELNDLLGPAIYLYPELSRYKEYFMSGSGSTFFRMING